MTQIMRKADEETDNLVLFLCGDVMTGRGIDQILPYPSKPTLYESYMTNAMDYVALAENVNGAIPRRVAPAYIWGDALSEFARVQPDLKIINLETAITKNDDFLSDKGIHYRMHPKNLPCITVAGIDFCVLANNHVLDWSIAGLEETLTVLSKQNIVVVGAGQNDKKAREPAIFDVACKGSVIVLAFGSVTSGVPDEWAATAQRPGINVFSEFEAGSIAVITRQIKKLSGKVTWRSFLSTGVRTGVTRLSPHNACLPIV